MRRKQVQSVAVPAVNISKLGVADANGFLQHGGEHRFKIAGGAADDLEHLRRGRLLLKRLTQFAEQPRILDGDDGLSGEVCDQLDLLVGKGTNFLAGQGEHTDQFVLL